MLGLAAIPAQAQVTEGGSARIRRVALAGGPAGHPATIYGAVDKPLYLVFDTALGKGAVRAPGVAVHRPAPNALVLTPSRAVRGAVPVTVPLARGPATFTLAFKPEAPDQRVEVRRSGEPAMPLAQRRPLIGALASQQVKLERSDTPVPDAIVQCRMSLRVRTPVIPQGATVELRTPDRSLCESANTLTMGASGGR